MTKAYAENKEVSWKWGQGLATGKVKEIHEKTVRKNIKGTEVVKHGSEDNPAYVIEQEEGNIVLKLHAELAE